MSFDIQKLRDITAPRGGLATAEKYQVSFFNLPFNSVPFILYKSFLN